MSAPAPLRPAAASAARGMVTWALAALLLLLTWRAYAPTAGFDFVMFDDDINLYQNPHLGGLDAAYVRWAFTDATFMHRYMPLSWLTFGALVQSYGLDPAAYHRADVLLHAITTLLVFLLVLRVLALGRGPASTVSPLLEPLLAAAVTAFWALHPLRVELVAWVSGLLSVQASMFGIAAAGCLVQRHAASGGARLGWTLAGTAAYLAAVLSYPVAIGVPVAVAAFDAWVVLQQPVGSRRALAWRCGWELLPVFILSAFDVGMSLHLSAHATTYWDPAASLASLTLGQRLAHATAALGYYAVAPWFLRPLAPIDGEWLRVARGGWLGLAALLVLLSPLLRRRGFRRAAAAVGLAFVGIALPFGGWVDVGFQACDRYTYLPGVVLAVAVALLAAQLTRPLLAWGALLLLGVAAAVGATLLPQQLALWQNTPTLYTRIMAHVSSPDTRAVCLSRMAVYAARMGQLERAEQLLGQARVLISAPAALQQAGAIVASLGELGRTAGDGRLVVPAAAESGALAIAAVKRHEAAAAEAHFRRALRLDPGFTAARYNYTLWLARQGRPREALAQSLWLERHGVAADLRERMRSEITNAGKFPDAKRPNPK